MTLQPDELFDRVHRLVTPELTGEAAPGEQDELIALLRDEPLAVRSYVAYIVDTASLRWCFALREYLEPSDVHSRFPWGASRRQLWTVSIAAVAAAASLLVVAATLWNWLGRPSQVVSRPIAGYVAGDLAIDELRSPSDGSVATLTRLINVRWSDPEAAPGELSRLRIGQSLEFISGQAEIIFDSGAEVVLDGPANFEIRSPLLAFSSQGTISARVGERAHGFTIETPMARIIDLGTEFGVAIGEKGVTEVAVFRGAVDLAYGVDRRSPLVNPDRLTQGEALRVDGDGRAQRVVSIDSDRFPVAGLVRRHGRREPIFANVSDNIRNEQSKKFYRIVRDGLREDSPAFVDRLHEWNGLDERGLPQGLVGAEYIMPFNDDKFSVDLEVSVTLLRPAKLYVFLSDSVRPPKWLTDEFVDTGIDIGLDEGPNRFKPEVALDVGPGNSIDTVFSVWERVVHSPSTIALGAVERPGSTAGYNMYGIAAVEL